MMKPYILTGKIEHGKGLGRTVGMPTANLKIDDSCKLPEHGVYATRMIVDGKSYHAVTNIGTRPSVDRERRVTIETFVIDFEGDIYGENVRLEVYQYLRPIQQFQGIEEVWEQVKKDVENAKKYLDMVEPK